MTVETAAPRPSLMRRLGAAGPVAIVMSIWPPLGGFILLAFLTSFGGWLRAQQETGMGVYVVVVAALLGLSIVPTYACAVLAGWAFGFVLGWPVAMVAITAGALLAFAIGRGICRDRVLEIVQEKPRWAAVYRAMLGARPVRTTYVITLLRVPPSSPFALTNFVLAAAKVPWIEYTIGTFVGIAPRTAVAAFAAAQVEQLRFKNLGDTWMAIAGIVVTLAVCGVLGMMAQAALRQLAPETTPRN